MSNNFRYLDEQYSDEKDIVMWAVVKNPSEIQYASERLKNDKEVIKKTLEQEFSYEMGVHLHIGKELKNDPEIKAAFEEAKGNYKGIFLSYNGLADTWNGPEHKHESTFYDLINKKYVSFDMHESGIEEDQFGQFFNSEKEMFDFIDTYNDPNEFDNLPNFQDTKILLNLPDTDNPFEEKLLMLTGTEKAPTQIKDIEGVKDLITEYGHNVLEYATETLLNSRESMLELIKHEPLVMWFCKDEFKNDEEIVTEAVKRDGRALGWASEDFKSNEKIAILAVKNDPNSIMFVNQEIPEYRSIVEYAVSKCGGALQYTSDEMKKNTEVIARALESDISAAMYVHPDFNENLYKVEGTKTVRSYSMISEEDGYDYKTERQVSFIPEYEKEDIEGTIVGYAEDGYSVESYIVNVQELKKQYQQEWDKGWENEKSKNTKVKNDMERGL